MNTEELLENIRYIRDWEATSKLLESEYKEATSKILENEYEYENEIGRQRTVSEASTDILKKVRWQLKLGYLYSKKEKYNEAIIEYGKAIRVKTKSKKEREMIKSYQLEAQYLRGEAYLQLGNIQEAIDDFKEVLNNNPKDELAADTLYAKATCYEKLADNISDEEEKRKYLDNYYYQTLETLVNQYPNKKYPDVYEVLGSYYHKMASIDVPDNAPATQKLELYGQKVKHIEKAVVYYRKAGDEISKIKKAEENAANWIIVGIEILLYAIESSSDETVRRNIVEKFLDNHKLFIKNCDKVIEEYSHAGLVNAAHTCKGDVYRNLLKLKPTEYTEDYLTKQAIESYQKVPSDCEGYYEYAQTKITELQKGD